MTAKSVNNRPPSPTRRGLAFKPLVLTIFANNTDRDMRELRISVTPKVFAGVLSGERRP